MYIQVCIYIHLYIFKFICIYTYICLYIHIYIHIRVQTCAVPPHAPKRISGGCGVRLYKISFRFEASLWESIILELPPPPSRLQSLPNCNAIARLLRDVRRLTVSPFCMPQTIQYWSWQYRVKATFVGVGWGGYMSTRKHTRICMQIDRQVYIDMYV